MPDDELNQNPPGDELEQSQAAEARVAELEGLLAKKGEELGKAEAQIAELEQTVADNDNELVALKQTMVESEEKLATINNSLTEAVASYKALVIKSNPEVLEQLVTGDTIDDINKSLEEAKTLVSKVREGLETEMSMARVPAGAPLRMPPDLSALSPREKIQYAIGGTS